MYKPNDITYPLILWYKSNKRNLPWRNAFNHENAPYQILVSEFMLQQTTVATVLNYYDRFIERWPTNKDLSNATEDEVLEIWSGLGYYSRGINLLKTSKIIFHDYSNKIPKNTLFCFNLNSNNLRINMIVEVFLKINISLENLCHQYSTYSFISINKKIC